jgi:GxxExxY protein
VYEKALMIVLSEQGLKAKNQFPLKVNYRGQIIGEFFADIIVEDKIILELKSAKALTAEHQAQLLNYLKVAGLPVGILVNFGTTKLEYRRFDNRISAKVE